MSQRNYLYRVGRITGIITSLFVIATQFQNCSDVSFSNSSEKPSDGGNNGTFTNVDASQNFNFGPITNKIDILVVVDNSGSMQTEQASLGAGFNNFIGSLTGLDWQIGVITTDVSDNGRFVGPSSTANSSVFGTQYIMNPNTPNVASVFADTVQRTSPQNVYLGGSGDERGIVTAQMNIAGRNDPNVSQGFYRTGSNLAIVILTDEDERSCGGDQNRSDCGGQFRDLADIDRPQSLINNFSGAFNGTKNLLVNGILIKENDTACFSNQNGGGLGDGGKYGLVYSQLVNQTAGILGSICDNGAGGFTDDLRNISTSISNNVNPQTITLDHTPISAPRVTFLSGPTISYTWRTGTPQITFSSYPANTSIRIEYTYRQ